MDGGVTHGRDKDKPVGCDRRARRGVCCFDDRRFGGPAVEPYRAHSRNSWLTQISIALSNLFRLNPDHLKASPRVQSPAKSFARRWQASERTVNQITEGLCRDGSLWTWLST